MLKGTLSGYLAASSTATGSIAIHVKHSNYHSRLLRGQDLTFAIGANTAVTLNNGTSIADGTRGVVKFRALKNLTNSTLMTALTTTTPMTAFRVIG